MKYPIQRKRLTRLLSALLIAALGLPTPSAQALRPSLEGKAKTGLEEALRPADPAQKQQIPAEPERPHRITFAVRPNHPTEMTLPTGETVKLYVKPKGANRGRVVIGQPPGYVTFRYRSLQPGAVWAYTLYKMTKIFPRKRTGEEGYERRVDEGVYFLPLAEMEKFVESGRLSEEVLEELYGKKAISLEAKEAFAEGTLSVEELVRTASRPLDVAAALGKQLSPEQLRAKARYVFWELERRVSQGSGVLESVTVEMHYREDTPAAGGSTGLTTGLEEPEWMAQMRSLLRPLYGDRTDQISSGDLRILRQARTADELQHLLGALSVALGAREAGSSSPVSEMMVSFQIQRFLYPWPPADLGRPGTMLQSYLRAMPAEVSQPMLDFLRLVDREGLVNLEGLDQVKKAISRYVATAEEDDGWALILAPLIEPDFTPALREQIRQEAAAVLAAIDPERAEDTVRRTVDSWMERTLTPNLDGIIRQIDATPGARADRAFSSKILVNGINARLSGVFFSQSLDTDLPSWLVLSRERVPTDTAFLAKARHEFTHLALEEVGLMGKRFPEGRGTSGAEDWITMISETAFADPQKMGAGAVLPPTLLGWLRDRGREMASRPTAEWSGRISGSVDRMPLAWRSYAEGTIAAGVAERLAEEILPNGMELEKRGLALQFAGRFVRYGDGPITLDELGPAARAFRSEHGLPEEFAAGLEETAQAPGRLILRHRFHEAATPGEALQVYRSFEENILIPRLNGTTSPTMPEGFQEAVINLMEHGHGGDLELFLAPSNAAGSSRITARLADQGPGVINPQELLVESAAVHAGVREGPLEEPRGYGWKNIAASAVAMTVEAHRLRWGLVRESPDKLRFDWEGPSRVDEGTVITLVYEMKTAAGPSTELRTGMEEMDPLYVREAVQGLYQFPDLVEEHFGKDGAQPASWAAFLEAAQRESSWAWDGRLGSFWKLPQKMRQRLAYRSLRKLPVPRRLSVGGELVLHNQREGVLLLGENGAEPSLLAIFMTGDSLRGWSQHNPWEWIVSEQKNKHTWTYLGGDLLVLEFPQGLYAGRLPRKKGQYKPLTTRFPLEWATEVPVHEGPFEGRAFQTKIEGKDRFVPLKGVVRFSRHELLDVRAARLPSDAELPESLQKLPAQDLFVDISQLRRRPGWDNDPERKKALQNLQGAVRTVEDFFVPQLSAGLEERGVVEWLVGNVKRIVDKKRRIALPTQWPSYRSAAAVAGDLAEENSRRFVKLSPAAAGQPEAIPLDDQRRVRLPERWMEWVGVKAGQSVVLLGVKDHLELWNPTTWEQFEAEAEAAYHRALDEQLARSPWEAAGPSTEIKTGLEETSSRRRIRFADGLDIFVTEGQFVPDDSARLFLDLFQKHPDWLEGDLLEIGAGAGAMSIFLARHGRRVVGLDVQPQAVADAKFNKANQTADVRWRLTFGFSDVYENLAEVTGDPQRRFDAAFFINPIFIGEKFNTSGGEAFKTAAYAGPEGEVVRRAVEGLPRVLKPGKSGFFFAATTSDTNHRVLSSDNLRAMLPDESWRMDPTGVTRKGEYLDGDITYEVFRITPPEIAAGLEEFDGLTDRQGQLAPDWLIPYLKAGQRSLVVTAADRPAVVVLGLSGGVREVQASLGEAGVRVRRYETAQQARAAIAAERPDLLLVTPEEFALGGWELDLTTVVIPAAVAAGLGQRDLALLAEAARAQEGGILRINDLTRSGAEEQSSFVVLHMT